MIPRIPPFAKSAQGGAPAVMVGHPPAVAMQGHFLTSPAIRLWDGMRFGILEDGAVKASRVQAEEVHPIPVYLIATGPIFGAEEVCHVLF